MTVNQERSQISKLRWSVLANDASTRFPDEFFKQIYRLQGWEFKPGNAKRPQVVGHLVNRLIYEQLPPGVLPELQRRNPPVYKGYRKYKQFQFLMPETGHQHLDKQIVAVTTLMRVVEDKRSFEHLFKRAFPKKNQQLELPYRKHTEEE